MFVICQHSSIQFLNGFRYTKYITCTFNGESKKGSEMQPSNPILEKPSKATSHHPFNDAIINLMTTKFAFRADYQNPNQYFEKQSKQGMPYFSNSPLLKHSKYIQDHKLTNSQRLSESSVEVGIVANNTRYKPKGHSKLECLRSECYIGLFLN